MSKSVYSHPINSLLELLLKYLPLQASLRSMLWTARVNGIKRSSLKDLLTALRLSEFILWAGIRNGMKPFPAPTLARTFDLVVPVKSDQGGLKCLMLCAELILVNQNSQPALLVVQSSSEHAMRRSLYLSKNHHLVRFLGKKNLALC